MASIPSTDTDTKFLVCPIICPVFQNTHLKFEVAVLEHITHIICAEIVLYLEEALLVCFICRIVSESVVFTSFNGEES